MRLFSALLLFCLCALPAQAAPAPPLFPNVIALSATSARLTWLDVSSDEAVFLAVFRTSPFDNYQGFSLPANSTEITLSGLNPYANYEFVVVAQDAAGAQSASESVYLTPVSITSPSFRAAYQGQPFSFSISTSLPSLVTGYTLTNRPAWLTLNATTGQLSGTPVTNGKFTGLLTVNFTGGYTATQNLTIRTFVSVPALQAPTAGSALPAQALTTGTTPAPLSIATLFTDPDVSTAARLTTDLGVLDFAFYPGSAPATVTNFLGYVTRNDFLNTISHRSIPGFIIQAGAFRADATASAVPTQSPVQNEPNITNVRGTVAMAKNEGNPNSATNQFFINLGNNAGNLDNQNEGFSVFARIAGSGMAVADAIAALPRRDYRSINGALSDTPVRGIPPVSYDPATLVRILAAAKTDPLAVSASSTFPAVATASITGSGPTLAVALTALTPGSTTITLTAVDLDQQSVTSSFPVTVLDTYAGWAARQSFALPGDAAANADPDRDGRLNLAEFALASAPLASGPGDFFPGLENNRLSLTFPLRRATTGISVHLQSAASPAGPWTTRWSLSDGFTHPWIASRSTGPVFDTITGRDPNPISGRSAFLRLKVTQP